MNEEVDQIDQEDPIPLPKGFVAIKKGGGEIPLPKGFEPLKKKEQISSKDFFAGSPASMLYGSGQKLKEENKWMKPLEIEKPEIQPGEYDPNTLTIGYKATDAPIGGGEGEPTKAAKITAGIYNTLVGSAARIAGGIGEMGQDYEDKLRKSFNEQIGRPIDEGILPKGDYRKAAVDIVEKLRSPVSTKEEEAKLSEFDIKKKSLGENIKALAFTAPSMIADVMAGTATGGATFFAQGVNDAAEEIESNPATKDLPEDLKLGYTYTSGLVNAALMKFNFDQIFKGTGVDKFITKRITNKVVADFLEQGVKATKEDIDKAVSKEVASLSSNIQRVGLKTAVSTLTGGGTGAAMAASHKGLQGLVNLEAGKEVFDTKNIGDEILNSAANLGLFSALTGGASSLKSNLDYINRVKDNVSHLPETHQVEFVKQSLVEKLANEKAERFADPTLQKQQKDIAKEAHEVKEQILAGKDPDEIVTTSQQKIIDQKEKAETEIKRLQEDNKLDNEKFDAQKESIDKELDGLDGRKPEDRDKIKSLELKAKELETKRQRANEDHEKNVAKWQKEIPPEEKPIPEGSQDLLSKEEEKPRVRVTAEQVEERQPEKIRQRYIDDFNVVEDSKFDWRVTSELSSADRKKAVADIKAGKDTAAARKLNKEVDDMMERGTVIINRGRGTQAETVEIPIDEWFKFTPIEHDKVIKAAESAPDEVISIIKDNDITLQNIDNLKDLFNGFPYDETDYNNVKTYLQGEATRYAETARVGEQGQVQQQPTTEKIIDEAAIKTGIESPEQIPPSEKTPAEQPAIEAGKGAEPPKEPPTQTETVGGEGERLTDKGILNRLYNAKNVPEAAKKGFEEKGLKYEPQSKEESAQLGKAIVDELGIDEAVTLAEANRFKGGVRSAIFAESLNKLSEQETTAKTPEEKLDAAKKFAEIGIRYDEFSREQGRDISQIDYFYKKSPLGIQIMENTKRKQDFEKWAKPKDKSWREVFDEMMKEPELESIVKEQVKEGMKQERAEARKARIKKVDEFFDKAKEQFKGGATYSTLIPPKVITAAIDGMQKAYHAGEKVVELVQKAIDEISEALGNAPWDKEKFRKEWEEKLKDKPEKRPLTDEELKTKLLDKFRNKLKGLSDKQKEEVVRRSFKQIVDAGALDYQDFRKIIADVTGRGEMTDAEAVKLRELVKETNAVDEAGKRAREERTQEARKAFREAEHKAGKAVRELNQLLYNRPNITKRLTSLMQLNTLGIPALVNNPIYNIINHLGIRLPVGIVKTGIERAIQGGAKLIGKEYQPEADIFSVKVQKEFFRKLGLGTRESVTQFLTGLNRMDYLAKEIQGQQIRPATAVRDLWAYSKGEKNLTRAQVIDKVIQASPPGVTAEIIARVLNLGDKPQRFAAEGAQAAAFAKSLGLKDIDYDLFIDFPREEAYRVYKAKGLSDAEAGQKADYVKDIIVKEGERSTFQQDNMLNDVLSRVFGGKQSGVGGLIKAVTISPYIKIPSNAYWSYYNIVNPEVAMLQSMIYAGKAFAKTKGVKFSFDKPNSSAAKDLHEAKYWIAHAAVGMATRAAVIAMVSAGIYRSGNTGDDTKKEREGEQFYENQGTMNISKLWAWLRGEDPNKVKNGLLIQDRWAGHIGTVGNTIARKEEEKTPEQKKESSDFWDAAIGNMELYALQDFEQGVFGNTQSLLSSLQQGIKTGDVGSGLNAWGVNTLNMFTNIVHPAASAQIEKAFLPYYTKQKADTFMQEVKNSMLTRSAVLRNVLNQYPPSKIGIWGDRLDKKDNVAMRLFGISKANDDNFAQPIYEDYKKTNDIGFFPPAVKPEVNNKKLNISQQAELEEFVGHARKELIAPFINDMAELTGYNKLYSQLSMDEKKKALSIIYELGYEEGKQRFIDKYPEFKNPEETVEEIKAGIKPEIFRGVMKVKQMQKQ